MSTYEEQRQIRIARNQALFEQLELENASHSLRGAKSKPKSDRRPAKRRKIAQPPERPQRSSARIAASESKPVYLDASPALNDSARGDQKRPRNRRRPLPEPPTSPPPPPHERSYPDVETLRDQWASWKPVGPVPTRDEDGVFHFESYPDFLPNKSPAEVIREGSFGGSYWRPLHSRALKMVIADDYLELPASWYSGLSVDRYLTNPAYDPEVNKYGVQAGQSIEAWEASGWINHEYDVRGWFQWYCRFYQGRRCDDDDRQIARWKKCVGETGRWRRILLKKYVEAGIRSATDEGDDDVEGVSPVIHQTCLHWAWEVRQGVLNEWWESSG